MLTCTKWPAILGHVIGLVIDNAELHTSCNGQGKQCCRKILLLQNPRVWGPIASTALMHISLNLASIILGFSKAHYCGL